MKPNSYKFVSTLLLVLLIVVGVFLFSSHSKKKFWKSEATRIEQETKFLDAQLKVYQGQLDSLYSAVANRTKEIETKDSIINGLELNLSKLKRKYDKIYSSLDELNATGHYRLFTTYTDTLR